MKNRQKNEDIRGIFDKTGEGGKICVRRLTKTIK